MNSINNYSHAVVHDIDESVSSIEEVKEDQIEYCVSLEHAQAIATQGLSTGWANIVLIDLRGNPRKK